jgi:hypothetical protein
MASFGGQVACGDSCDSLAKMICSCRPNQNEENACDQAVSTAHNNRSLTAAQQQICSQLMHTCTCAALQDGHLEACGLSK